MPWFLADVQIATTTRSGRYRAVFPTSIRDGSIVHDPFGRQAAEGVPGAELTYDGQKGHS
jgi:hypothetical protein